MVWVMLGVVAFVSIKKEVDFICDVSICIAEAWMYRKIEFTIHGNG